MNLTLTFFLIYSLGFVIAGSIALGSYFMNQPGSPKYFETVVFFTIFWPILFIFFWWVDPVYDFDDWVGRLKGKL